MSNETTTLEISSTVQKSTCLCNYTVSESSHEDSSVTPHPEVDRIVTSEKIGEDPSTPKNNFEPEIKKNATEVSQCNTSQKETYSSVSLIRMKQKLFKAMHSGESCCSGCRSALENVHDFKVVNDCPNCENQSLKAPPIQNSPLLDHVVQKLLKENVDKVTASDAGKDGEHTVNVAEDIASNTKSAAVTPVTTNNMGKHVLGELKRNNIYSRIDALLADIQSMSDSEDEIEENPFIETMAEEGEEDTPSEGSSDIVEVGEEINTTESELSSDESYENNSFIDDEENYQLLSGEEYDLSLEEPKERRRIIQLSSGSDDEIVRIPKKEKNVKKRKKSRIIRVQDSSDEELPKEECVTNVDQNGSNIKLESCNKDENESLEIDVEKNVKLESCVENENVCKDLELAPQNMEDINETSGLEESNNHIKSESGNENENVAKINEIELQNTDDASQICDLKERERKSESHGQNENVEVVPQKRNQICDLEKKNERQNKKIIILENIRISDVNINNLSQHVNNIINSKVKIIGDIYANLSGNEETEAAIATPVNSCKTAIISECAESVTNSGRKKRKRKGRQKKNMKQASDNWTEKHFLSDTSITMSSNPFKNYFKFKVENPDSYTGDSKKLKKRKRDDSNNSVCDVEPVRKKKKKNKLRSIKQDVDTHANILEQAILYDSEARKCLFNFSGVDEDWKVKERTLTPSQISETSGNIKVYKKGKESKRKSLSSKFSKLYEKDFKNQILCNNGHSNRVETKHLLRKKD